ncbi:MAG: PDZ domain-containing protein [Chloroflexi bacterium]|nr:PDZ domain-containing protein [Chloroflexota bacterium]
MERLLEDKKAGRVSFGLSIADASRIALKHGAVPILGAFVGKVSPHSPAQRAGIQAGDIITEVNLRPIGNALDLEKALASLMPGSRVTIVFLRGEQRLRTELAL